MLVSGYCISLEFHQEKHQLSGDVLPKSCNKGEDGERDDEELGNESPPVNSIVKKRISYFIFFFLLMEKGHYIHTYPPFNLFTAPEKRQRAPSAYNQFIK